MELYGTILLAVTPVFLVMGLGMVFRWRHWLTQEAEKSFLKLILNLFYPALVLKFVVGNPALDDPSNILNPPLVGFATILLGFGLAWLLAPLTGVGRPGSRPTFAFTCGMFNYGYIPIPLSMALFGSGTTGVLLVHNVGVEVAFWSVGVLLVSGGRGKDTWKKVLNPPLLALVVALVLNFAGFDEWGGPAYAIFEGVVNPVGACAIPMGLIISGAILFDLLQEGGLAREWRPPLVACLIRLGLLPLIILGLALVLPVSTELKQVLIIQASMPAAMLPIVVAKMYGGDTRIAVQVVATTSAISILTIPAWIGFSLQWFSF